MTKIRFKTTASARQAAFIKGEDLPVIVMLEVNPHDLTPEQREVIAPHLTISKSDLWHYDILGFQERIEGGTIQDVVAALQKYDAEVAEQTAQIEQRVQEFLDGGEETWEIQNFFRLFADSDLKDKVNAEQKRRLEAEIKAQRQKTEADAAAHNARVEALKNWTMEHGTDYLRDLITMGYNWKAKAEKFWFEMHTPPGFAGGEQMLHYADNYPVDNPTPEGIEALKAAKKEHGENVRLIRIKFNDGEKTWYEDYLSITLTSPLEKSISVEKFASEYTKEKA